MSTTDTGVPTDAAGVSRRTFLHAGLGGAGVGALGIPGRLGVAAAPAPTVGRDDTAVILLLLVGGPSQLETWDPKPDAPAEVRGPFRSIATTVPGVRICEHLPRLARRMDRLTLIRSVYHEDAPIHETGLQRLQTGTVGKPEAEAPHVGSVAARMLGTAGGVPPFVILPRPVGHTGVGLSHGQGSGPLGPSFAPFLAASDEGFDLDLAGGRARRFLAATTGRPPGPDPGAFDLRREPLALRDAYGRNPFGQNCLRARRLVEAGSRFVVVNMASTVFHEVSWDCHGSRPFSILDDYRRTLLPTLDMAFSTLVDDLDRRGRLGSTLVVAAGEFGRTPRLNAVGGRDHWPRVWSVALAGGGTRGGQVIGASDATASEPAERPVHLSEVCATMTHALGLPPLAAPAVVEALG